jgi:hypothetical protein
MIFSALYKATDASVVSIGPHDLFAREERNRTAEHHRRAIASFLAVSQAVVIVLGDTNPRVA